jgi:hypothetical protein
MRELALWLSLLAALSGSWALQIGYYNASIDSSGNLLPQSAWDAALLREMAYYKTCPRGALQQQKSQLSCPL